MANSKNTVTTVPLASKLNMNRNQNQVCSTYDQMNKQNSPLYGGCIYPLHTRSQYLSSKKSIIDKYGYRWFYNGTGLYRTDENNSNQILARNFSGYYTFTDTEIEKSADAGCLFNGYLYIAKKVATNMLKIYQYNLNGSLVAAKDEPFNSNYDIKSVRLVVRYNILFLIVTEENSIVQTNSDGSINNSGNDNKVRLVVDRLDMNGTNVSTNKISTLGINKGVSDVNTIQGTSFAAGGGSQSSNNTYPIIVGNSLGLTSLNGTGHTGFGITVLNRHLDGENLLSNFGYRNYYYSIERNALYTCKLSLASGTRGRYTIPSGGNGDVARVTFTGGKAVTLTHENNDPSKPVIGIDLDASGIKTSLSSNDNVYTTAPWGMFQEGNDEWVIGNYSPDGFQREGGAGAQRETLDHIAVSCDCGGIATCFNSIIDRIVSPLTDGMFLVSDTKTKQNAIINRDGDSQQAGIMHYIQNQTLTTNQYHYRMIFSGVSKENGFLDAKTRGVSVMLDSMAYGQARTWPGIQSTTTIPTTSSNWENVYKNRYVNNDAFYCTSGSCTQVGNWRLLFNYREGFLSGISWSPNYNYEGTLITPWDEVDDGFVVSTNGNTVVWKDVQGTVHVTSAIACTEANLIDNTEIIDNRYLLIKSSAPQNVFDLVEEKWGKFGSDWNNRVLQGYTRDWEQWGLIVPSKPNVTDWEANEQLIYSSWHNTATWASGFNVAYQATKTFSPSRLLPFISGNYVYTGSPLTVGCTRPTDEVGIGSIDKCTLDYFCSSGTSSPKWAGSLSGTVNGQVSTDFESSSLQGTAYPIVGTGSLYNNIPVLNVKFINSYNGKFATQISNKGYSMIYDGVRPVMLYNTTSIVDNIKEFFIVQSQTYAVVDSYICAISYSSSNVINGIEQLVDVNGMTFIGSFPSVAYFYSPSSRCIYAFTGDADLQLFVQTDRINAIYDHLYAPNNEWIFINTNDGIYVFTQQNVFRIPYDHLGVLNPSTTKWFMTDDAWNVIQFMTDGGEWSAIKVRLDKPDSLWSTVPVEVETEFFGKGDMKQEIVDTWYIRIFKGDEKDNLKVITSVKTLTDIVKKTDERELIATPDKWDDNDNIFIRYQPQYQMTQGSSLYIKSYYPIAYLGCSHQMDNTSLSHNNI